jgi:hypothetical protein
MSRAGRRRSLARRGLARRLVANLFPVVLDDAAGRSPGDGMMPGYVTDHAADRRSFQAAFGNPDPGHTTSHHDRQKDRRDRTHDIPLQWMAWEENTAGDRKLQAVEGIPNSPAAVYSIDGMRK